MSANETRSEAQLVRLPRTDREGARRTPTPIREERPW
jgi:hypothetical protein